MITAAFYTADLSFAWLSARRRDARGSRARNRAGVERLPVYLALGSVLRVVRAQVRGRRDTRRRCPRHDHPAQAVPRFRPDDPTSPLHVLEHAFSPGSPSASFRSSASLMPASLAGIDMAAALAPVPLGIAAGLFVGKQIGAFSTTWAAVKLDRADCPEHASFAQVYGVSLLCGIGFTMSLFIALLAFPTSPELQDAIKIGVLVGSISSAIVGAFVLRFARGCRPQFLTTNGRVLERRNARQGIGALASLRSLIAGTDAIAVRQRCSERSIRTTLSLAFLSPRWCRPSSRGGCRGESGLPVRADLPPSWNAQQAALGA